jgi:NAD(P)-dependent dehydrogenase (short-subunit alcohol dehydrogenase family)
MKSIVITGCSSGFGRATAFELARRGWRVFATVRRDEDRARLSADAAGLPVEVLVCDIADDAPVAELGRAVAARAPHLDALLNNAGTAYPGPLEVLPLADLRRQLEVNVVAQLAVTQALLPLLKAARGMILNVSSVGGRLAYPITGAYHASKFALEALSDSLRIELAPFGVRVVVIEPGGSPTAIWDKGERHAASALADSHMEAYRPLNQRYLRLARRSAQRGFPPEQFASLVAHILKTPRPRARYAIPAGVAWTILARRLMPDWAWDALMRRVFRWG